MCGCVAGGGVCASVGGGGESTGCAIEAKAAGRRPRASVHCLADPIGYVPCGGACTHCRVLLLFHVAVVSLFAFHLFSVVTSSPVSLHTPCLTRLSLQANVVCVWLRRKRAMKQAH